MIDHFRERYKNKTREELEVIVSSRALYQKEAVQAAVELLGEKFDAAVEGVVFEEDKREDLAGEEEAGRYVTRRSGLYFKTFSRREMTTAFCIALLYLATISILDYCSAVDWISYNYQLITFVFFAGVSIVGHVFYKKEHGRSNLFWGRVFQVMLTCIFIFIFIRFRDWLQGDLYLNENRWLYTIFYIALATELLLSVLRRILLYFFKWQTW